MLRSGGSALRLLSEKSKASSKTNFSKIGSKESISSISLLTLKEITGWKMKSQWYLDSLLVPIANLPFELN